MRNQTDRIKQRIHNSEVTVGEFQTYKDAKDYIDKYLEKYQGVAREVLEHLLDTYTDNSIFEIDGVEALTTHCQDFGGTKKIFKAFGDQKSYIRAIREMEHILYDYA